MIDDVKDDKIRIAHVDMTEVIGDEENDEEDGYRKEEEGEEEDGYRYGEEEEEEDEERKSILRKGRREKEAGFHNSHYRVASPNPGNPVSDLHSQLQWESPLLSSPHWPRDLRKIRREGTLAVGAGQSAGFAVYQCWRLGRHCRRQRPIETC